MQIETDRLILREFQQIDFKELAPILADPKVMKFATTGVVERANTASARVLGKVGMRYERTTIFHGVEMDLYQVNASAQTIKSKTSVVPFKVRVLNSADAEAYRDVRLQALHEHPPAFGSIPEDEPSLSETAVRLLASDDRCFFGAFQDERLIGIVRLSRYEAPNEKHRAYLGGLYVLPLFRRNGCGRALVEQVLSRSANIPGIRRINLTVVTQQEAALRLYQSLGFQIYGTEQETFSRAGHFYDEHLLTLNLVLDNVA